MDGFCILNFMKIKRKSKKQRAIMLFELLELWEIVPDLRLGQLISNACPKQDLFYVEDYDLIKYIKAFLEINK